MFHFLNKHIVLQWVLIVLMLVGAGYLIFTRMTLCPPDGQGLLYAPLHAWLAARPLAMRVTASLLLLLLLLLIQRFFAVNKFCENKTWMPVLFLLGLILCGRFLELFSPTWVTLPMLAAILLLNTRDANEQPVKNRVFASGIMVGLCTLIDPYSVWILLFIIMALLANRFSSLKEIIILICGFEIVYAYVFSVGFLADTTPVIVHLIKNVEYFGIIRHFASLKVIDYVLTGVLLLSFIYMVATLTRYFDTKLIVLRKRFLTIILLFVVMLVTLVFSQYAFRPALIYLMLPLTLLYSMMSLLKNRRLLNDILIVAVIVLLCL
jgi:hypothetical protein